MLRPMLGLLVAAALAEGGAPKEAVEYEGLCRLAKDLAGKVLLRNATCCLGVVREAAYLCPVRGDGVTFNGTVEQYLVDCDGQMPRSVIIARGSGDVSKALAYVKAANVEFRVKSGGHSQACLSTVKDGVVISLEQMKAIEYYALGSETFISVESGVTASELHADYTENSAVYFPHGLDPWIGMGGHMTGGGFGHLIRKFGFASDFVVGADIVLPSGELVQVFEPEYEERVTGKRSVYNPRDKDLLWAIKGSGHANFGIVTKFYMRTIPRPEYVVLGAYEYAVAKAADLEAYWTAICAFYSEEPGDEAAGVRNLLVWPTVSQGGAGAFSLRFRVYYIPDSNGTAQGALAEATPVVNAFLAKVPLPLVSGGVQAAPQSSQFPDLVDPAFQRTSHTCVARVVTARADVCGNTAWVRQFANYLYAETRLFADRGSTFSSQFNVWGGAAALADPSFERTSVSTRNAFGTVQYCRIPLAPGDRTPLIHGAGGTREFNATVLAAVGGVWYLNAMDPLVTEPEQVYPEPAVLAKLRTVKRAYDPLDVFARPLGVALPSSPFLAGAGGGGSAGGAVGPAAFCALAANLTGTVLLPSATCCGGAAVQSCESDAANAGLSYAVSQQKTGIDCDAFAPSALIVVRTLVDVKAALAFAAAAKLAFRIRSGGQSPACASTCSDCVVITLEAFEGIEYARSQDGATYIGVEPGVTVKRLVRDYLAHADVYFPHGAHPTDGIGGHLAGGGAGMLTRKFGFASDFVVGVEVVLANGKFVKVFDEDHEERVLGYRRAYNAEHQDLLWAVRGNGHASVGVVTKYWLRTVPRPRYAVQGQYVFAGDTPTAIKSFWESVCGYYASGNASRNLVAQPRIDAASRVLAVAVFYFADDNRTAADAWAEAEPVLQDFLSHVSAPLLVESVGPVKNDDQFLSLLTATTPRTRESCTSRVVLRREAACENPAFLEGFAARVYDEMLSPLLFQAFSVTFTPWGSAAADALPAGKSSLAHRAAFGLFEYCRDAFAGERQTLWDAVDSFNATVAADLGAAWSPNYADRTVPDRVNALPFDTTAGELEAIKAKYDPANLIRGPLSVPFPARGW